MARFPDPQKRAGGQAAGGGAIVRSGGTRIEVDAAHLDAVRAVIGEIARLDRGPAGARVDRGGQRAANDRDLGVDGGVSC